MRNEERNQENYIELSMPSLPRKADVYPITRCLRLEEKTTKQGKAANYKEDAMEAKHPQVLFPALLLSSQLTLQLNDSA